MRLINVSDDSKGQLDAGKVCFFLEYRQQIAQPLRPFARQYVVERIEPFGRLGRIHVRTVGNGPAGPFPVLQDVGIGHGTPFSAQSISMERDGRYPLLTTPTRNVGLSDSRGIRSS